MKEENMKNILEDLDNKLKKLKYHIILLQMYYKVVKLLKKQMLL